MEGILIRGWVLILLRWCWLWELPRLGFDTVPRGIDPGTTVFVPGLFKLQMHGNTSNPGMGLYPSRGALALQTRGWGFQTVRGVIDQKDHYFRPLFVGVVDVWKHF